MQFLAMLTMLIDHIGLVWFPDDSTWRLIGRLALPFYAYALVLGYSRTQNMNRYLLRVGSIAIISQLPYQFAIHRLEVNTVGTLFICLLLLSLLDKWSGKPAVQIFAVIVTAISLESIPISYGSYALLLVLIYRYTATQWMLLSHFSLNLVNLFLNGGFIQIASLFSTLLIVYVPDFMRIVDRIRIPRIVWRSFYPLHLALIAVIYAITTNRSGGFLFLDK